MIERTKRQHAERSVRVNDDGSDGVDSSIAAACDYGLAVLFYGAAREINDLLARLRESDARLHTFRSEDILKMLAHIFSIARTRRGVDDNSKTRRGDARTRRRGEKKSFAASPCLRVTASHYFPHPYSSSVKIEDGIILTLGRLALRRLGVVRTILARGVGRRAAARCRSQRCRGAGRLRTLRLCACRSSLRRLRCLPALRLLSFLLVRQINAEQFLDLIEERGQHNVVCRLR